MTWDLWEMGWEIGCGIGRRWGVGLVGGGICERWDVRLVGDGVLDWWEMG